MDRQSRSGNGGDDKREDPDIAGEHNTENHMLYPSSAITVVIRSRATRTGHGVDYRLYKVMVGNPEAKRPVRKTSRA